MTTEGTHQHQPEGNKTHTIANVNAGAHKDIVRGVRWLGPTARIVSFSSERLPNSAAFRNTLLLSDARSRASLPLREVGGEDAPMLGIRSSPTGRYILVLLRGAPSEIWAVRVV